MSRVRFTKHAVQRFQEGYTEIHPKCAPKNPEEIARRYLASAAPDTTVSEKKKKKLFERYGPRLLLRFRRWRFVIKEEKEGEEMAFVVITAIAQDQKKRKKKKR